MVTSPNERSDPVEGYTDVTPEQLDKLHRNCGHHSCDGYRAEQFRRSTAQWQKSLLGISAALAEVREVTRAVAARVQENARSLDTQRADFENLQAGLQHQRIGNARF